MYDLVDQVLEERGRTSRRGFLIGLLIATLGHGALVATLIAAPWHEPPEPLEIVPVKLVSAAALGTPQPRRPVRRDPPKPEPVAPEPEPVEETVPEPEPVAPEPEPEPSVPEPEPASTPAVDPPDPAPANEPPASSAGPSAREGSPTGSAAGVGTLGAEIAGVDPGFGYDYYLDRMLSLIRSQWVRPPAGDSVKAVVRFTIDRGGKVSDLDIVETSGLRSFDLAALRAVQNASPLPRLPRSYRKDTLRVTLIVR